ncbi:hypothetical protein ZWY2020_052619 [Hordeum vulgare]|nr:hypothetical protein ZWY2020_052619 [Hordeum vulgare]
MRCPGNASGASWSNPPQTSFFSALPLPSRGSCPALLCSALYKKSGLLLHKHTHRNQTPTTHRDRERTAWRSRLGSRASSPLGAAGRKLQYKTST